MADKAARFSIILIWLFILYDIVQYHQRNKHLREILITKFDKYNEFISKKKNKKKTKATQIVCHLQPTNT